MTPADKIAAELANVDRFNLLNVLKAAIKDPAKISKLSQAERITAATEGLIVFRHGTYKITITGRELAGNFKGTFVRS